jgi:hypothetical protein
MQNHIKQKTMDEQNIVVALNVYLFHLIYRISRPIRHTMIFLLEILEKNECILILGIYWKKRELLHTKISNHNIIYSS